jgi:nuclear pore complex protein Nup98-Nup96
VSVTKAPVYDPREVDESGHACKLLSHHLSNSTIQPDADGVPFAHPGRSLTFSSFISLFAPTDRTFEASLFRLGHALFDDLDLHLADTISIDIRNRIFVLCRKHALSTWLQEVVASTVEHERRNNLSSDPSASIFTLLTGNQVDAAVEAALESGNVKMATLIAQSGGDHDFRDDLRAQLQLWREQRIDAHMSESTRKIYGLLAGVVDVLEGSNAGARIEQSLDINMAQELDWKRAFGLHLWFGEPLDSAIVDAFHSYVRSFQESSFKVAGPLPWYAERSSEFHSQWKLPSSANPPDALFSFLRLFVEPACSLSNVLVPLSFGPSPADYRLCWHLYILMSRSLRVRDFADRGDPGLGRMELDDNDDDRIEGHSPSADLLANSYAFQLEQLNLVQEAAFVLLHIEASAGYVRLLLDIYNHLQGLSARISDGKQP